jgi:hypothetical protein
MGFELPYRISTVSTNIPIQRNTICFIPERRRHRDIGLVCRGSGTLDRPFAVH